MHIYFGDIVATIFISTFLYLAFEVPFLLIEDYCFKLYQQNKMKRISSMK